MTTCASTVLAMRALGAKRLALIHPPWIAGELNEMGATYFRSQGLDVVLAASAALPGGQRDVHPEVVYQWTRANVPDDAEAVFFGGNGFRVIGAIQAVEEEIWDVPSSRPSRSCCGTPSALRT